MHSFQICLVLGFLLGVHSTATPDPTKVCYPTAFTSQYFDMITEDHGVIAFDFSLQKFVQISNKTGARILHDYENLKSYAISGQENNRTECRSSALHQSEVMLQCLPPYAKLVSGTTGLMGYQTYTSLVAINVQTWDVETEYDTVHRIVFRVHSSASYPPWPIVSQEYGYSGTSHLYMYLDGTTIIKDKAVFTIPPECKTEHAVSLPIVN